MLWRIGSKFLRLRPARSANPDGTECTAACWAASRNEYSSPSASGNALDRSCRSSTETASASRSAPCRPRRSEMEEFLSMRRAKKVSTGLFIVYIGGQGVAAKPVGPLSNPHSVLVYVGLIPRWRIPLRFLVASSASTTLNFISFYRSETNELLENYAGR